ncbi:RNA methyltransferase [Candidatus Campbellbacteria bacterium]|nr:MAG: RNA methyltransferase [Candidatus Campbellbacteria bacterium]
MIKKEKKEKNETNYLVLDSVRSVLNVGAIFRTADAIGVNKIFLCGYCPTPEDRFGRIRKDFQKTSLGAKTPWEYRKDILELVLELKKEGFNILAVEQDKNSVDYKKAKLSNKNVIIMGNENFGVGKKVLENADQILELPMKGFKNSLNVSVTTGIILYSLLDK